MPSTQFKVGDKVAVVINGAPIKHTGTISAITTALVCGRRARLHAIAWPKGTAKLPRPMEWHDESGTGRNHGYCAHQLALTEPRAPKSVRQYKAGDRVHMTRGPLAGYNGNVVSGPHRRSDAEYEQIKAHYGSAMRWLYKLKLKGLRGTVESAPSQFRA